MGIQPQVESNSDIVEIKGTYNKEGMVSGAKATFCGQTSIFTIDGDIVKGVSDDDSYGSYTCEVSSDGSYSATNSEAQVTCEENFKWNCLTNICP